MNTPYLRAFLYDSSHQELQVLAENIFNSWEDGIGVSVIDKNLPKHLVDSKIISIDPGDVIDIATNEIYKRDLAIFDENISVVSLTSGTTSKQKPVVHTFDSMMNSVQAMSDTLNLTSDDSWLLTLSPKFIGGMAVLSRAFYLKQKISFINKFNIQSLGEKIAIEKPSLVSLVPAQLKVLLDAEIDLSGFKAILIGGSSINKSLIKRCMDLDYKIHTTYGMTETFGGICHDSKLFKNTQARIIDEEIQLKSTSIFSSYRHNFVATNQKFTNDGWYKTGDLGTINESGELKVNGRSDDIIISGGIKINPIEIELKLKQHIDDAFIVGGKEHEKWGQALSVIFEGDIPENISIASIRELLKDDFEKMYLPTQLGSSSKFIRTESGKIIRKQTILNSTIAEVN